MLIPSQTHLYKEKENKTLYNSSDLLPYLTVTTVNGDPNHTRPILFLCSVELSCTYVFISHLKCHLVQIFLAYTSEKLLTECRGDHRFNFCPGSTRSTLSLLSRDNPNPFYYNLFCFVCDRFRHHRFPLSYLLLYSFLCCSDVGCNRTNHVV